MGNLKLGVNIDHVATLRQARGTPYPNPADAATICAEAGAHGLTVHLREDRRHMQDADVYAIRALDVLPLNLEMAATSEMVNIALDVRPAEVCLVPEKRHELTTEGGLDVARAKDELRDVVATLSAAGMLVSMFIEPSDAQIDASHEIGAPLVELHTGQLCELEGDEQAREKERLIRAAGRAHGLGLQVNAGHGINLDNVRAVLDIPHMHTLNIGHSIIARAVFVGLEGAVKEMLHAMAGYP